MGEKTQFGRLSRSEYSQLLRDFRRARAGHLDFEQEAARKGKALHALLQAHGAYWWVFYELPYAQHIALMCYGLGWTHRLREAASSENPPREFLKLMAENDEREDNPFAAMEGPERGAFLNLLVAAMYSLESIGYFGLSINELLSSAKAGDRDSLLRAVSVDRCVLVTATSARLMSTAQLSRDKRFFASLIKRVKAPHAARRQYVELRFFHRLLKDVNSGVALGADELLDLVGHHLRLYSTKGEDPVKGIRELFRAWNGESTS